MLPHRSKKAGNTPSERPGSEMKYIPNNTTIAVIGGGNIGTQFACVCAAKGYRVNVYTSKPDLFDGTLEVVDEFENVTVGKINKATADIGEAIDASNIIFVTQPAFMLKKTANRMLPYIRDGMNICAVPGTGGVEFAFRECIYAGATLCGLQRVPSVARLTQYGKRVRCEGLRSELFLSSIPSNKAEELAAFMSALWGIACTTLPNYLSVTLTPSNPILHTTRLKTLFEDYRAGRVYDRNPLFYGEWDDKSSNLLIACDDELQQMLRLMDQLNLSYVRSLRIHYQSESAEAMTRKLSSIKSLHSLASPMKRVEGGWVPDFNSRYFTADFAYGLAIIEAFAMVLGYDAINVKRTMNWYRRVTGEAVQFDFGAYGIHTLRDIYALY